MPDDDVVLAPSEVHCTQEAYAARPCHRDGKDHGRSRPLAGPPAQCDYRIRAPLDRRHCIEDSRPHQ